MKLATALVLAVLAASARAEVLVVDDDGGTPYTTIQQAIDAAVPGDVVFVHSGNYGTGFVIDGKPLTIIGESGEKFGPSPKLNGTSIVRNVAAGTVKLDGLYWQGGPIASGPTTHPALVVADCDGSVRISDCVIAGFTGGPGTLPAGAPGLRVVRSYDVVVSESLLTGAAGGNLQPQAPTGGPGLLAVDARVSVWESDVKGGLGGGDGSAPGMAGGDGGPAALLQNSFVMFLGCPVTGGQGGSGLTGAGDGGSGVSGDASSTVWKRGSTISGGIYGLSPPGSGSFGPPITGDVDVITLQPEWFPYIDIPNQLVESGQSLNMLVGVSISGGLLGVNVEGGCQPLAGWQGPLTLGPGATFLAVPFGSVPVVVPALPPGLDQLQAHLQIFDVAEHTLGRPLVLTIVAGLP